MSSAGGIKKNQSNNVVALRSVPAKVANAQGSSIKNVSLQDTFKVAKGTSDYHQLVNKPARVSTLVPVDEAHATLEADMNVMALSEVFGDLGSEFKMDAKDLEFLQQLDEKGLLA